MRTSSLAVQGQSKNARAAAESMLKLLQPMLGNRWRMEEASTSDVVILDAAALDDLNKSGTARPGALYVVFEESTPPPANAFSTVRRPLNSSQLIEVLHKAQATLGKRTSDGTETADVTQRLGKDSAGLSGIQTSMRTAISWVLQSRSAAVTVTSLGQAHLFSVLPDLGFTTQLDSSEIADLIRSNGQVNVVTLNDEQRKELFSKHRKYYPLKKLEWIYWLAGSNGELRPELDAATPYRLWRWPDFGRLPHYRADVRMASLLKAEAMAVGELSERACVRAETATNFLNACWSLGLLTSSSTQESAETSTEAGSRLPIVDGNEQPAAGGNLFGSLRSALGLGVRKPHTT